MERARKAAVAQLAAAQSLPAAYLREMFETKTAKKWPTQRLADIVDLLPAKSVANNGDAEVKVITTACLTERGFDPRGIKLARMHSKDVADCTVTQKEVLIARSNTSALVGRVSAYDYEASDIVASDLTIRLRPKETLVATFLSAHLSYLYLTGYWRERAGGASDSMKKITRRQIIEVNVPVPPLETQNMVVNQLKEKFDGIEQLISTLSHQSNALGAMPAALLRQAFNGEL